MNPSSGEKTRAARPGQDSFDPWEKGWYPRGVRKPQWIPVGADAAGLALALALGLASLAITRALPASPYVSDILVAIALGALILNSPLRRVLRLALPSAEREPDPYAPGLRFTGKWVLRIAIVLMGLKVQTKFFGAAEVALIACVAGVSIPSAFFVAHAMGAWLGLRRPLVDLVAGGTMICGASAVQAIAPVAGAHREEQGIAIATVFLFSVGALLFFRPIALLLHLDPAYAGLWSGLAVNDLSSAIAVGKQMGGAGDAGGVMAAAAKSARVLLLAPTLVAFAVMRRGKGPLPAKANLRKSIVDHLPGFLLGYLALAVARALGDRLLGESTAWAMILRADRVLVDVAMVTVSASIGLHLEVRRLLRAGARALAVGGVTSLWMASVTLAMIYAASRGERSAAALVALVALGASFLFYRIGSASDAAMRVLRTRFQAGSPLSLAEAKMLLDALEHDGPLEDVSLKKLLGQLFPAIGELIPVRESPLPHGDGCRWMTYWEGQSGWALVAVCREPGSATPIHAHPHRLLGKSIEGTLEELRFHQHGAQELELLTRTILGHNDLVETEGLATLHVVRVIGTRSAIDLQLRGPEVGSPGRRFRTDDVIDFSSLAVGARLRAHAEIDDRPGQGGEGAAAGRVPAT